MLDNITITAQKQIKNTRNHKK